MCECACVCAWRQACVHVCGGCDANVVQFFSAAAADALCARIERIQ